MQYPYISKYIIDKANNPSLKVLGRKKLLSLISEGPEPGKYNPNYNAISK